MGVAAMLGMRPKLLEQYFVITSPRRYYEIKLESTWWFQNRSYEPRRPYQTLAHTKSSPGTFGSGEL